MAQLDQDRVLPCVGGDTFYLQGLVPDPSEECVVRRGELRRLLAIFSPLWPPRQAEGWRMLAICWVMSWQRGLCAGHRGAADEG